MPGSTDQTLAPATSAGSRSSGVVVVTIAWGSASMRRTRCERRSGSSSLNTSSSSSSGGRAVERREEVELGELEREDGRALLAARREGGEVPTVDLEDDVVAVRPDERGAVPELLLGGLAQPAPQRVAVVLARRAAGAFVR